MASNFPCVACPTQFFHSRADLFRHYSVFHKSGKIPCPQCSVEMSTMQSLSKHLKIHDPNRIREFKCTVDQCGQTFYTAKEAKRHVSNVHSTERPFLCPFQCGKCFKTKGKLQNHILRHTQEKPYKCGKCDGSFQNKSNLQSHIQYRHNFGDEKLHQCTQCEVKFKTTNTLKCHIRNIHTTRTKVFPCSLCPKAFSLKHNLTQHYGTHDPQRKLAGCYFCSKRLTRGSMEDHLRIHTTEKPFSCPEKSCNYSSASRGNLHQHVRNVHHNSQDRWKHCCYFCLKICKDNSKIAEHMRIHTLEEPFSCQLCNKSCKSTPNLNQHVRSVHTKETPYNCNQCEKFFCTNGELKSHTAIHTGEKRFFCDICSYSSYYSENLKRHHKNRHCDDDKYGSRI